MTYPVNYGMKSHIYSKTSMVQLDKHFYPTIYIVWKYLSMLGLKLTSISKRAQRFTHLIQTAIYLAWGSAFQCFFTFFESNICLLTFECLNFINSCSEYKRTKTDWHLSSTELITEFSCWRMFPCWICHYQPDNRLVTRIDSITPLIMSRVME